MSSFNQTTGNGETLEIFSTIDGSTLDLAEIKNHLDTLKIPLPGEAEFYGEVEVPLD